MGSSFSCSSVLILVMRCSDGRSARNIAISMPACSTMATEATITKKGNQRSIPLLTILVQFTRPVSRLLILRLFALIGFFAGIQRRGKFVLGTLNYIFAVFQELIGAFTKLARLALRVFASFVGAFAEKLASLFAGFGSE